MCSVIVLICQFLLLCDYSLKNLYHMSVIFLCVYIQMINSKHLNKKSKELTWTMMKHMEYSGNPLHALCKLKTIQSTSLYLLSLSFWTEHWERIDHMKCGIWWAESFPIHWDKKDIHNCCKLVLCVQSCIETIIPLCSAAVGSAYGLFH